MIKKIYNYAVVQEVSWWSLILESKEVLNSLKRLSPTGIQGVLFVSVYSFLSLKKWENIQAQQNFKGVVPSEKINPSRRQQESAGI